MSEYQVIKEPSLENSVGYCLLHKQRIGISFYTKKCKKCKHFIGIKPIITQNNVKKGNE